MSELISAAKAVIEDIENYRHAQPNTIENLCAAVERAEKQERVGFGEWFEYQDKYLTAEETWTAAKEDERERIRARAEIAAEKTWKAGDWYIGPQHANLAKFIDALLEDGDE